MADNTVKSSKKPPPQAFRLNGVGDPLSANQNSAVSFYNTPAPRSTIRPMTVLNFAKQPRSSPNPTKRTPRPVATFRARRPVARQSTAAFQLLGMPSFRPAPSNTGSPTSLISLTGSVPDDQSLGMYKLPASESSGKERPSRQTGAGVSGFNHDESRAVNLYIKNFLTGQTYEHANAPMRKMLQLVVSPEHTWDDLLKGYSDIGRKTLKYAAAYEKAQRNTKEGQLRYLRVSSRANGTITGGGGIYDVGTPLPEQALVKVKDTVDSAMTVPSAIMQDKLLHDPKGAANIVRPRGERTLSNPGGYPGILGTPLTPVQTAAGARGRALGRAFLPTVAGTLGAAGAGAATGSWFGPWGAVIGGGFGAIGAGAGADVGQEYMLDHLLSPEANRLRKLSDNLDRKQQPGAVFQGETIPQFLFVNPVTGITKAAWKTRAIGGAMGATTEAASEAIDNLRSGHPLFSQMYTNRILSHGLGGTLTGGPPTALGRVVDREAARLFIPAAVDNLFVNPEIVDAIRSNETATEIAAARGLKMDERFTPRKTMPLHIGSAPSVAGKAPPVAPTHKSIEGPETPFAVVQQANGSYIHPGNSSASGIPDNNPNSLNPYQSESHQWTGNAAKPLAPSGNSKSMTAATPYTHIGIEVKNGPARTTAIPVKTTPSALQQKPRGKAGLPPLPGVQGGAGGTQATGSVTGFSRRVSLIVGGEASFADLTAQQARAWDARGASYNVDRARILNGRESKEVKKALLRTRTNQLWSERQQIAQSGS